MIFFPSYIIGPQMLFMRYSGLLDNLFLSLVIYKVSILQILEYASIGYRLNNYLSVKLKLTTVQNEGI